MEGQSQDQQVSKQDVPPTVTWLVVQAQQGSTSAFEVLYTRYKNAIYRYTSRQVNNEGVGSELTQEIFVKAWSSLPSLRSPEHFASWLYRIATYCIADYLRRTRHLSHVSLESYLSADISTLQTEGPEEEIGNVELMEQALARVSPTYRACLILYVIEELPQSQIAECLHIKKGNVGKYVSRGKEELRQIYRQLLKEQERMLERSHQ